MSLIKREGEGATLDFTDEDRVLLEAFANQAGVAIENAQLYQEALEGRQLQAEMDEAAKIQQNLIPDTLPEISGYEATGLYFPRGGVGGDYYDCLPDTNGTWGLAIADVSGKGMQAALLMATLRAGLHSEVTRKDRSAEHGRDTQLTALCKQYLRQICNFLLRSVTPGNGSDDLNQRRTQLSARHPV